MQERKRQEPGREKTRGGGFAVVFTRHRLHHADHLVVCAGQVAGAQSLVAARRACSGGGLLRWGAARAGGVRYRGVRVRVRVGIGMDGG